MKAKIQSYLVLDVETGGIPDKNKLAVLDVAITEVALVMVSPQLEIVGEYSSLIKPYSNGAEYGSKAAEVSGITKQDCINEGKDIKRVVADCIEFINTYKDGSPMPLMVGHNLRKFDSYFMENMFLAGGEDIYKYVSKLMIDTMEESWKVFPEAPDYKLGTMCGQYNIELVNAHRALPDTIANANLWINFLKGMRGDGEVDGTIEVERIRHNEDFKY